MRRGEHLRKKIYITDYFYQCLLKETWCIWSTRQNWISLHTVLRRDNNDEQQLTATVLADMTESERGLKARDATDLTREVAVGAREAAEGAREDAWDTERASDGARSLCCVSGRSPIWDTDRASDGARLLSWDTERASDLGRWLIWDATRDCLDAGRTVDALDAALALRGDSSAGFSSASSWGRKW